MPQVLLCQRFLLKLEQLVHTHVGGWSVGNAPDDRQTIFSDRHHRTGLGLGLHRKRHAEPLPEELRSEILKGSPLHNRAQLRCPDEFIWQIKRSFH